MASTSVIFMAVASVMGSSALARRSVQVEPGPDLESPELANEIDEGRDDGLEPELPLLRGRQGRVADRPRLRDPRPPLDQPDGRAAGQVVPGVLRLVEADLLLGLLHLDRLRVQMEVDRGLELTGVRHPAGVLALAGPPQELGDERRPEEGGAEGVRLDDRLAGDQVEDRQVAAVTVGEEDL